MPPDTIALAPHHTRRLPRYHRASHEERPGFKLTDRDRELLKYIYDYRFITAAMVQDLAQPVELSLRQQEALDRLIAARRAKLTGRDASESPAARTKRKILHRLMVLYHHGYAQRLKLSDREPIVYALGNKGADELVLYYGIDRKEIDWTQRARENGERYIRHGLMVSRFRHALTLALREFPDAKLDFWEPNGAFTASVEYEQAVETHDGLRTRQVKGAVIPDGFFALTYRGKAAYLFLEADRSTMSNARYAAKLAAYFHYWVTQIRGGEHPSGMKGFRVLTLTLSEERKDNLRRIAQEVNPQGRGLDLFWFACERSYQARPQELLAAIWQTPLDDSSRRLFA
jgi:Replication-relaxation